MMIWRGRIARVLINFGAGSGAHDDPAIACRFGEINTITIYS
jgi:hypothetical protein